MAKDKHDMQTKDIAGDDKSTEAAQSLYKVTYSYVHSDGSIRTGAIAIEADNEQGAKIQAGIALEKSAKRHTRITKIAQY